MLNAHCSLLGPLSATAMLCMVEPATAGCNDPPEPYVDWGGCNKEGTDLAGAKLFHANLEHTNLKDANLTGADLRGAYMWSTYLWGANLSNANLMEAETQGAYLKESIIEGAVWQDGRVCAQGSVDGCY